MALLLVAGVMNLLLVVVLAGFVLLEPAYCPLTVSPASFAIRPRTSRTLGCSTGSASFQSATNRV